MAQSSIPDPGPAGDREDTEREASHGSGEDPGLAQENVLTVGEGEGRNSPHHLLNQPVLSQRLKSVILL